MRFIATLLLVCFFWQSALATHFYVRTDGSDGNTGMADSSGGAWLTADKAFKSSTIGPGDTVHFKAGTFPVTSVIWRNNVANGTAANPITWTADGAAIISSNQSTILRISSDDYWVIDGAGLLEFTNNGTPLTSNTDGGGIFHEMCDHITIKNVYLHDIGGPAVFCGDSNGQTSTNVTILTNRIARCQWSIYFNAGATGSNLVQGNVCTDPYDYSGAADSGSGWDCDYMVMLHGSNITVQQNAFYGATEDQVTKKGSHTGTNGSASFSGTMSNCFKRCTNNELVGKGFQNRTTGATGTISSYVIGTPCTVTGTLSGGTRQTWNAGDVFVMDYPHLDGIQTWSDGSHTYAPLTNLVIQDNYFGDNMAAWTGENNGNITGKVVYQRNVQGPGFPELYLVNQPKGNGPISSNNISMDYLNNTSFGYTYGPTFTDRQPPTAIPQSTPSTIVAKNNISFNQPSPFTHNNVASWTESYNNVYGVSTSGHGTGAINSDPAFVIAVPTTSADVLGADGLFGTPDDGLRLTSGSASRGAGEGGVDLGAYQYTAANTSPVVTITAPITGATFLTTDNVPFNGSAIDAQDGDISSGITWTSNIDGALGTGASITHGLTAGTHTITASRTDSGSLTGTAQVSSVAVTAPPAGAKRPGKATKLIQ